MSVPDLFFEAATPEDLALHNGDRFEIAEVRPGLHRTIVRRDFDGTTDALTFDPGETTEAVFILGGRGGPTHSEYVRLHVHAIRASTQTLRGRA